MAEQNEHTYIRLHSVPCHIAEKLTHLSDNIGYDNRNDLIRKKIKDIINENQHVIFDSPVQVQLCEINVKGIHNRTKQKLNIIAKSKGYASSAAMLMEELRRELDKHKPYMLLKNKGFKEIENNEHV